jgi:arabinan endo-1,5-alpha-L-arabinosidase
MHRRRFLRRVSTAATGIGVSVSSGCLDALPPNTEARTARNPVFEHIFADPSILRAADGAFYAYATYQNWGAQMDRRLIPIIRSRNLIDWEYVGQAFATKPDWLDDEGLWAPEIGVLEGRYVLYYSFATFESNNPGIGIATATVPGDTFTDRGKLFSSAEIGVPNSIDPCLVVDDGRPFLFWGSFQGIYGIQLSPDGLRTRGEPFQIAGPGVEAAYIIKHGDYYYLFGSRGTCCSGADSTYHVVVGRSKRLISGYENRAGDSLLTASGTMVLHGDATFAGPGHTDVIQDDTGTEWLVYHAYERTNPWVGPIPRRVLMLSPLRWADGWPRVATATPSRTIPRPVIRKE